MKLTYTLIPLLVASASLTSAQNILFDFQSGTGTPTPAGYNLINVDGDLSLLTESYTGLTDSTGAGDYSLEYVIADGHMGAIVGAIGDDSIGDFFPDEATVDGVRINEAGTTPGTTGLLTVTFGGLDDSLVYDMTIFANSGLFFTADVDYTVGSTVVEGIDTTTPSLFTLPGLSPSGGSLVLAIQSAGTGNAFTRGSALNAVSLAVVPEPSSFALLGGVAAFAVCLARRRGR